MVCGVWWAGGGAVGGGRGGAGGLRQGKPGGGRRQRRRRQQQTRDPTGLALAHPGSADPTPLAPRIPPHLPLTSTLSSGTLKVALLANFGSDSAAPQAQRIAQMGGPGGHRTAGPRPRGGTRASAGLSLGRLGLRSPGAIRSGRGTANLKFKTLKSLRRRAALRS